MGKKNVDIGQYKEDPKEIIIGDNVTIIDEKYTDIEEELDYIDEILTSLLDKIDQKNNADNTTELINNKHNIHDTIETTNETKAPQGEIEQDDPEMRTNVENNTFETVTTQSTDDLASELTKDSVKENIHSDNMIDVNKDAITD